MVTVRRVLPAPPDIVYDEWLDPVGMLEWMCPRPARAVRISLEPSVGGSLRIDIDDGGFCGPVGEDEPETCRRQ